VTDSCKNSLYFGDNLDILRSHVADESVNLIYLDPPFNSAASYNVLFAERSGERSAAQITAFEDTWGWGIEAEKAFHEMIIQGGKLADLMETLRKFLGNNDMMAYLTMMAPRLVELRRVLAPTGSIYLHCDPTASHYLKMVMDAIFGPERFTNEIVWKRTTTHNDSKTWSRVSDTILFYTKSGTFSWNVPREAHSDAYVASKYRYKDADGRQYMLDNMTSPNPRPNMMYEWKGFPSPQKGWRYSTETMAKLDREGRVWYPRHSDGTFDTSKRPRLKRYLGEMSGPIMGNVWVDIFPINSQAQERLGYPTQKPEALLERIIKASSNEGDVVLDPFCGCGTAISVAERLHRHWIGIDITHLAVTLIKRRLVDTFGDQLATYEMLGEPKDLAGAAELAQQSRHQFEWWALSLVDARPAQDKRKGADRGIDGEIRFFDDNTGTPRKIVVQVKSGHVNAAHVRDLKGVMEREKAQLGVFITLERPTKPMMQEAVSAGFYEPEYYSGRQFPKLQILTIEELLSGKPVKYPRIAPTATFKTAERKEKGREPKQRSLL